MKHSILYLCMVMFTISFIACKDDATSSNNNNNNNNNGNNIPESEFSYTASGGDPRGTYTPNTPTASAKLPTPPSGYSFAMNYTKNTGSGTLTLEGTSATSGTYTKTNLVLEVEGAANVKLGSTTVYTYPFPSADYKIPFADLPNTGTWKVEGNTLFFNGSTTGMNFSTTSKGIFLIHSQEILLNNISYGTATLSVGLRKSN